MFKKFIEVSEFGLKSWAVWYPFKTDQNEKVVWMNENKTADRINFMLTRHAVLHDSR